MNDNTINRGKTHTTTPVGDPVLLPIFPTIHYPDYEEALGMIVEMAKYHKMCRIIGHPGSGKTTLLLDYKSKNENAVMLTPSRSCTDKDVLKMLGSQIGYYVGTTDSTQKAIDGLITYLNTCGRDTVFLIDEADNLCSHDHKIVKNISKLETLRHIHDHTKLHTSFIFAAPYDLEVRLQHSSESITSSQFYRRCSIQALSGISEAGGKELLERIEVDFRISFSASAKLMLVQRMLMVERGGLGIVLEALEKCMMFTLPQWHSYYRAIELSVPRSEALDIFKDCSTVQISEALVADAFEKSR